MELGDCRRVARGPEKHYNFYKLFINGVSPGLTRRGMLMEMGVSLFIAGIRPLGYLLFDRTLEK